MNSSDIYAIELFNTMFQDYIVDSFRQSGWQLEQLIFEQWNLIFYGNFIL